MDVTGDLSIDLLVVQCRACTNQQIRSKMYFLYKNPEITEIFKQSSTLQIYEKDGLPTHICQQCYLYLKDFISFRKTCISSDETFRHKIDIKSGIESNKVKVESIETCEIDLSEKTEDAKVKVELEELHICDNDNVADENRNNESYSRKQSAKPRKKRTKKPKIADNSANNTDQRSVTEPKVILTCDQCGAKFNKKHRLEAHLREHLGLKPFECKICDKSFRKYFTFNLHNKVNHSNEEVKTYNCTYDGCDKTYNSRESLQKHIKIIHCGYQKPQKAQLMCEICGKSFKIQFSLKEHMYTHTGETPFPCTQCVKKFKSKEKLKVHLLRHANIKNHVCTVCGLRKTTRRELRVHMDTHKEGKIYSCDFCTSSFQTKYNLVRHNRSVHCGYKPYACTYCQQSFAKAETLKHHTMTHTGEKPHACPICDKRFIQSVALKTHLKVHAKHNNFAI